MTNINETEQPKKFKSEYAILLTKMRLLKKLTRKKASLLFDFSFKNLERLENGRGNITPEKFRYFQEKYGFSDKDIEDIKSGKITVSSDANQIRQIKKDPRRLNKRFRQRWITKECKVLKELRLIAKLSQEEASRLCGYNTSAIGQIENGRVDISEKRIMHIVHTYGFDREFFNQLVKKETLNHELVEQCISIIKDMDENKLKTVHPLLLAMGK